MHENPDNSGDAQKRRDKGYDDPHYHDDDDIISVDDVDAPRRRVPDRRQRPCRPPPRRPYDQD